ncbi:hypothetical protein HanRHA438_Chr09g0412151 [Helianthus annuus]|uniref:Rapid ALkalinization Factor n=1 Tax=Helianthus annuus TaxID=4232 RepID=A0A9K3I8R2_HELAN|nr:hypothetical protein HanXRQr2_Chr09g0400301 [Helianthus annuus]KAJ0535495.1 hypothetical protein HanIR_Chr09g0431251 [Helianthus annuus]KAJ0889371.1 hypothetical protein HanRHA438_Chr09g0412151 [Helianthus annuus]KAJ0894171.1 hypothetical protein HanPSC8_Chr09g0386061 [Helianthus annuus]
MLNGRSFSNTILSLSFILMITIIKDTHGSTEACNYGTTAECPVFNEEEQEFLLDTQEHRLVLETTYSDGLNSNGGSNGKRITYKSLNRGKPVACGSTGCSGKRVNDVARRCKKGNYSCR